MAYNKINKLKRIAEVQTTFKSHYQPGMSIEWIYQNKIYPTYKISRSTFYAWMKIPADSELKAIENGTGKTPLKQIEMDFAQ